MSGVGDIIEISSSIAAPKTKPAQQGPAGGLALAAFVKRPQAECSNRRMGETLAKAARPRQLKFIHHVLLRRHDHGNYTLRKETRTLAS
jgi:hypothetical protein